MLIDLNNNVALVPFIILAKMADMSFAINFHAIYTIWR